MAEPDTAATALSVILGDGHRAGLLELARQFAGDDAPDVVAQAEERLRELSASIGYLDRPWHPLAEPLFWAARSLALYLVLAERGVGAKAFGPALVDAHRRSLGDPPPAPPAEVQTSTAWFDAYRDLAAQSQASRDPAEFVWEVSSEGDPNVAFAQDVLSCPIARLYARSGASDLAPYACATDDVTSDHLSQGLRRTGTIALGAERCDFRYERGGVPVRLAESFPDVFGVTEDE